MAFLNGENISHDLIQALFGNDSEEVIQSGLNDLAEKSLIIDNNDSFLIEQSKQNEIIELIDNIFVPFNIASGGLSVGSKFLMIHLNINTPSNPFIL